MNGAPAAALVAFLLTDFGMTSLHGQATGPARVFGSALEQIRSKTSLSILLPSRLPSAIPESGIKIASGEVRKDGYFISLYYTEDGNASYAAGLGGSTFIIKDRDVPNSTRVALSNRRTGIFRPVSCGGSCGPANLWWEQNGVMYHIQAQLSPGMPVRDQKETLVEMANSTVAAPRE